MPESDVVERTDFPLTAERLAVRLRELGLASGQTVIVHTAMSRLNWVIGGAQAVIAGILKVLANSGTLLMPTFTAYNTDPSTWQNPPVHPDWWPTIRAHMPAFDPDRSPTRGMGVVSELFRTWPGVLRSAHPVSSFAAFGPHARYLIENHKLESEFGEYSPLARLYDLGGSVLLLGVGHSNNSSLHLAETRASYPGKQFVREGSSVMINAAQQWVEYDSLDYQSDDFDEIGEAFDRHNQLALGRIGSADVRFFNQRLCVDFAKVWFERHRT